MEYMLKEQQSLTSDLKGHKHKCESLEKEISDLKSKLDTNQINNENLEHELHEQKVF